MTCYEPMKITNYTICANNGYIYAECDTRELADETAKELNEKGLNVAVIETEEWYY